MKKMSLKKEFKWIEYTFKSLIPHHIADQKVDLIFHDYTPFGIVGFTKFATLTGTCSSYCCMPAALHSRQMRQLQNLGVI